MGNFKTILVGPVLFLPLYTPYTSRDIPTFHILYDHEIVNVQQNGRDQAREHHSWRM